MFSVGKLHAVGLDFTEPLILWKKKNKIDSQDSPKIHPKAAPAPLPHQPPRGMLIFS